MGSTIGQLVCMDVQMPWYPVKHKKKKPLKKRTIKFLCGSLKAESGPARGAFFLTDCVGAPTEKAPSKPPKG